MDARDGRAGVKVKDADLMGCPIRVVVGKGLATGVIEVKQRGTDVVETVALADIIQRVTELRQRLLTALNPTTHHV